MTPPGDQRRLAVLDTSFWIAAYRAEVIANCLDQFAIVVPSAVESEIRGRPASDPRLEYPYATLFRHLRGQLLDPPVPGPVRLDRFGAGEAEAIPVAEHLGACLLINDHRAARYAADRGIPIVNTPAVVVALYAQGIISTRAAQRKLELLEGIVSGQMIELARRVIAAIQ